MMHWSKVTGKIFVTTVSLINKMLFFSSFYFSKNPKKICIMVSQKYEAKMFLEQQISIFMISEELCDTEDWRNDAENSAAHHSNELYVMIY